MTILITGAAGRVGRILTRELGDDHDLLLGDVRHLDDPRFIPLDVLDFEQAREAVARADVVAHLAIADSVSLGGTGGVEYAQAQLQVQVAGVYNVLRAAAEAGGKRVAYASSISAVQGYPPSLMVGSEHRHLGGGLYGLTKGFGEELCRMFAADHRLPVMVLRLGHVYIEELQRDQDQRHEPYWIHESDVARAFRAALEGPVPPFAVVHIVGDNVGRHWDLEMAQRLLGWEPHYSFGRDGRPQQRHGAGADR